MIKVVLFDMDGTLIDTEKYYHRFWREALEDFGYEVSEEQLLSLRSLGRPFAPQRFREWYGDTFDYLKVKEHRKELMEPVLRKDGIRCKKGARELLEYLREQKIPAAVATASDMERTTRYLDAVGLTGYFDRLISATQVEQGKPAPDIYRFACEQLGFDPGDCMAVEDAPNGVLAAYRAGCKVVMVPDLTEPDEALQQCLFACVEDLGKLKCLMETL